MDDDVSDVAEWLGAEAAPEHAFRYLKIDPELFRAYRDYRSALLDGGVLPRKVKLLMALAVLTSQHASEPMSVYTRLAREAGATIDEVKDALRVGILFSGGMGMTAAGHLADELEDA
jgi:alkylhydroperoxidase/carboxymuconolactone decarboxylase family protein YurZ